MQLPPETNKHDVDGFGTDAKVWIDTVWKETPCSLRDREIIGVEEGPSLVRVRLKKAARVLKYTLMGTMKKNQGTSQEDFVSRKYFGSFVFKSALHWLKAPRLHKTVYIYTLWWSYRTIILQKP